MNFVKAIYLFFLILLLETTSYGAKVSGIIKNAEGESLPFATIYVKEIDFGTTTNLEGYYEIELKNGEYTVIIQFLGYESRIEKIKISDADIGLDIILQSRSLILPNLVYMAGKEDPAYAIMRRVIARSKYHLYQLKSYHTQVYVKGSGRLKKAPFFLRGYSWWNPFQKSGLNYQIPIRSV